MYFVHNVSATVSSDRKELVDIMTVITHPVLEEYLLFNESDGKDLLQTPDKALIPVIRRVRDCGVVDEDPDAFLGSHAERVIYLYHWSY